MNRRRSHFIRNRDGRFATRLGRDEGDLLARLAAQAAELVSDRDPVVKRVFPTAYPQDAKADAEYQTMMSGEIAAARIASLTELQSTATSRDLDESQLHLWLDAIEVMRLALGTSLDVGEDTDLPDPDTPNAGPLTLYYYLGAIQEEIVDALAELLPEVDLEAGELT